MTTITFEDAGAIVLAGGRSRRMGEDKSLLPFQGAPLIQHLTRQLASHFAEIILSTNRPDALAFLDLHMVPDIRADEGPLMGIASALRVSPYPWNFVIATDMPFVPIDVVQDLYEMRTGAQCVVAREPGGRSHPLFGWYHRDVADKILSQLDQNQRRVTALLDAIETRYYPLENGVLINLNTPEDLANARAIAPRI
jgi:molybdenum cofactor guanylyltransferase